MDVFEVGFKERNEKKKKGKAIFKMLSRNLIKRLSFFKVFRSDQQFSKRRKCFVSYSAETGGAFGALEFKDGSLLQPVGAPPRQGVC